MVDGLVDEPLELLHVVRLAERPHHLRDDRLGGHVSAAQDPGMVGIGAAHLVDTQVESLLGHLRGEHEGAPRVHPIEDGLLERGLVRAVVGDAAQVCVDILSRFRFEDALFRRRSEGEVSASGMSQLMAEAQESTYADAVSDKHELMWAVKGHYYSADFSYYNYPYAFGQLFALALFSRSSSDPDFSRKDRSLLSMTGRASCEEVAAMAGADITSVDFWREGLSVIGGYIGRLKRFADKM